MADSSETDAAPVWNLSDGQWEVLARRVAGSADALEDGAYARRDAASGELVFYATALNKPAAFAYPFLEGIPSSRQLGAAIGRAWHESATGFVHFEVAVLAAAQELAADYESGASDLDWVTYEQAVESAVRGTPGDLAWLYREFGRLALLAG